MDIKKLIKDKRENLKDVSIKSYISSLKILNDNKEIINLDYLLDFENIKKKLSSKKTTTIRNYLTAILVVLDALNDSKFENVLKKYREYLEELTKNLNDFLKSNEKTESQKKNWTTLLKLKKVVKNYLNDINERDLKNKGELNKKDRELLKLAIVGLLYTDMAPKRLDYAPMLIINNKKDIKPDKNYLLNLGRNKKYFVIQEFKTSNQYGKQEVLISKKLNTILNIYLKHHEEDSFLLDSKGKPLTANGLGKLITKVFLPLDKKITLNIIRHITISESLDLDLIRKQQKLAEDMNHNSNTQIDYAKN